MFICEEVRYSKLTNSTKIKENYIQMTNQGEKNYLKIDFSLSRITFYTHKEPADD